MAKRLLMPLIAAIIIAAMVIPGCGDPQAGPWALETAVAPAGAGSVAFTGTSPFEPNAEVPVQATANAGWRFDSWTATGGFFADAMSASTTFTMPNRAATITANFVEVRTDGFWLDRIIIEREPDHAKGITELAAGAFQVYAYSFDTLERFNQVMSYPDDLWIKESFGSFNTLRLNPYGPEFTDGSLNPFHYAEVREAVQWFLNRDFYAGSVMGGMAEPKYTFLNTQWGEAVRYADLLATVEDEYGWDLVKGMAKMNAAMLAIPDVTWDGAWLYKGSPVSVTVAIRSDDPVREIIGFAVASSLEDAGFTVVTKTGDKDAMLDNLANVDSAITSGGWNMYTGGWILTAMARDELWWPLYFHTNAWAAGIKAYAYLPPMNWADPYEGGANPFYGAAYDAAQMTYTTMDQPNPGAPDYPGRRQLAEILLPGVMEQSSMIYLVDTKGFSPIRLEVDLAADGSGGIMGSWLWAYTAHFRDPVTREPIFGGTMRMKALDTVVAPWNPVAGSNWAYDMFPIRATGDMGFHYDTRDGLIWPSRAEKAEVYAKAGLPIGKDPRHDWVTLVQVPADSPQLQVPAGAWADWDAKNQEWITAAERHGTPLPYAVSKSVVYYPKDMFTKEDGVRLHDGSTISPADFLMYAMLGFDRAKTDSAIYDESRLSGFATFMSNFLAVEFDFNDPNWGLVVTNYTKFWDLDAELMVSAWWPNYAQGPGFWHTMALGVIAEAGGLGPAFSQDKADDPADPNNIWMSFITGETLGIFRLILDDLLELGVGDFDKTNIPYYDFFKGFYGPGQFDLEIVERFENLDAFATEYEHFWVASGPYYIESIATVAKAITMRPFLDYPDPKDKWLFLLDPIE